MPWFWLFGILTFWLGYAWRYSNEDINEFPVVPALITWLAIVFLVAEGLYYALGK